jgi:hypothetical protein
MKSKHFLLTVFIFISLTPIAHASHFAGNDLSYTHITGSLYRIHYSYYRDCFGIPAPASIQLRMQSVTCSVDQYQTLLPIAGTGNDISLFCPGTLTTCNGGVVPGMQKWVYEADVNLTAQCPDWIFSVSDCCRNSGITTLQNAGGTGSYLVAHLNNSNSDNSSPQFTNDPLFYACIGQDFHYNNGAFDADGDSIAYNLVCTMADPNTCATYLPGYSAQHPFSSSPPVTFDSFTGDFFMHPTALEVGTINYQIQDYRNGVLMGSVSRDVIMYTTNCNNNNPTGTEMNGTSQQIAYVLPTDTICFDIFSDDLDLADSVSMTWNQTIPAATFTVTTGIHPTGTFCWSPALADVRSQPYMFTAFLRDNFCPFNNAAVYSYYIYVTLDSALIFLGSDDAVQKNDFGIFPNPSIGAVAVTSSEKLSQIKIYNAFGSCVSVNEFADRIDISSQPAGIYFVEIETAGGRVVRKKLVKE